MEMVQVILMGGSPLLQIGMVAALDQDPSIRLVAQLGEAVEIPTVGPKLSGDVLILNTNSPFADVDAILADRPVDISSGRVLVLTECDRLDELRATVRLGIGGYGISRELRPHDLTVAVHSIAHDRRWACPQTIRRLFEAVGEPESSAPLTLPGKMPISERELAVLRLAAAGAREAEIAAKLFLSPNTVKTYLRRIRQKLHAESRSEAIQIAMTLGLISPLASEGSGTRPLLARVSEVTR
ncbi:MAG: response regulator transcription factor [Pirellulales bacterium]|nr:response regulator transcription factor [Pirellulales bacterium]